MSVLSTNACMYHVYDSSRQMPEESLRYSGTGITNICQLSWELWDPNADPVQEQEVLLTLEVSLLPQGLIIFTAGYWV